MTHTHHRRGSKESLEKDFVVLAMIDPAVKAQHTYNEPLVGRVKRFLDICGRYNPVALAARTPDRRLRYLKGWKPNMDSGIHRVANLREITTCEDIEGIGHAVYTNKEDVVSLLEELRAADLGLSIVVSGVFEEVFDACKMAGIEPHTVNMSLETWGKTDLLPKSPVLELCTMCGHAMIAPKLAETLMDRVTRGVTTPEEAAVELGKQCTCNIFNTVRAAEIIRSNTIIKA
ncbi:MAG: hypothetical protein NWF13_02740 [Candidatus Bathyarchaeota archaeon]|nr:hypothetical protein [Candidatus Bathyarchaeota archaeon]